MVRQLEHFPGESFWDDYYHMRSWTSTPALSRAWTFQERMLAPRVLHFCAEEIVWDCMECRICECGSLVREEYRIWHTRYSPNDNSPSGKRELAKVLFRSQSQPSVANSIAGPSFMINMAAVWSGIVSEYTHLALTYPEKDKLAAIDGFAKVFQEKTNWNYCSGLWKENLISDLAWQQATVGSPPDRWDRPSWTWAAVDGNIQWPVWVNSPSSCLIMIEHVRVLGISSSVTGQCRNIFVRDGVLELKCGVVAVPYALVDDNLKAWDSMPAQRFAQTDGFVYMAPLFTLHDGGHYRLGLLLRNFTNGQSLVTKRLGVIEVVDDSWIDDLKQNGKVALMTDSLQTKGQLRRC